MCSPDQIRELYLYFYRLVSGSPDYGKRYPVPHWDGGTGTYGTRYKPVWPKLAERFTALQLDPTAYITWRFNSSQSIPYPQQLLTPKALACYAQVSSPEALLRKAETEFAVDLGSFQAALAPRSNFYSPLEAVELTLRDEDVCRATALFRVCFGMLYELPTIWRHYWQAGLLQYRRNRAAYDLIWGDRLPAAMRLEHA